MKELLSPSRLSVTASDPASDIQTGLAGIVAKGFRKIRSGNRKADLFRDYEQL